MRLCLVFTYIWQEDVAKIPKVPGAPCNVNLEPAEVCRRNHLLYHFLITIHITLPVFKRQTTSGKNQQVEMLLEQIIEFEVREPGPLGGTCTPTTGYFYGKTKISM